MKPSPPTIAPVAGAFAAVAVCLLAFPSEAPAEVSHDTLWGAGPGGCSMPGDLRSDQLDSLASEASDREARTVVPRAERDGAETPLPASTAGREATAGEDSPCTSDDAGSLAAHNRCFEDAGAPASVVPTLLARAHALDATRRVVSAAQEAVGGTTTVEHASNPPASLPVADVPSVPDRSNRSASCTPESPENCRSLPPAPGHLNVEASPVPPNLRAAELDTPERPDADDDRPRGTRGIERSDGYDSPPHKPPRPSVRSG